MIPVLRMLGSLSLGSTVAAFVASDGLASKSGHLGVTRASVHAPHLVPAPIPTSVFSATDAPQGRSSSRDRDLYRVAGDGAGIATSDGTSDRRRHPLPAFPPAFQGRWAHVAADCRAGGFSAILSAPILSIDADGLHQGEGVFTVTSLIPAPDDLRHSVIVQMSVDGRERDSRERFTLSNDGRVIEWLRLEPAAGPAIRLHRCR